MYEVRLRKPSFTVIREITQLGREPVNNNGCGIFNFYFKFLSFLFCAKVCEYEEFKTLLFEAAGRSKLCSRSLENHNQSTVCPGEIVHT